MRRVIFFIVCLLLASFSIAMEQDPYPFTSVVDAQRFASLTAEIRCVVCQNQSIAESNAPLANDLRGKVYLMVKEQQSAEEIKNYLVQRYGEFILLQPRFNSATFLLWSFPIFALGVAVFILFRLARR